jgi:hypothetical protein
MMPMPWGTPIAPIPISDKAKTSLDGLIMAAKISAIGLPVIFVIGLVILLMIV